MTSTKHATKVNINTAHMRSPKYVENIETSQPRFKESSELQLKTATNAEYKQNDGPNSQTTFELPYIRKAEQPKKEDFMPHYEPNSVIIRRNKEPNLRRPNSNYSKNESEALYDSTLPIHQNFNSENDYFKFDDEFVKNEDRMVDQLVNNLIEKIQLGQNKENSNEDEESDNGLEDIQKANGGERFIDEFNPYNQNNQNMKGIYKPKYELIQKNEEVKSNNFANYSAMPASATQNKNAKKVESKGTYVPKYTLV